MHWQLHTSKANSARFTEPLAQTKKEKVGRAAKPATDEEAARPAVEVEEEALQAVEVEEEAAKPARNAIETQELTHTVAPAMPAAEEQAAVALSMQVSVNAGRKVPAGKIALPPLQGVRQPLAQQLNAMSSKALSESAK
jgi:hypothetical protein